MPKLVIHSILNGRWNKLACIRHFNSSNSRVVRNKGEIFVGKLPVLYRFEVGANNRIFSLTGSSSFISCMSNLATVQRSYYSTDTSSKISTDSAKLETDDKAASSSSSKLGQMDDSYIHEAEQMEKERQEKYKKSWRTMKIGIISLGATVIIGSLCVVYGYGTTRYDDQGNVIIDQYSSLPMIQQIFCRAWNEFYLFLKSVPEPSREKLLPDPLKEPYYQPKYTVVFEISGVFVHPDWTFNTGWRFKKRPAVEYFLKTLGYPRTELVVYTTEQGMTAHPIIEHLDPDSVIMYRLYRDTTKYQYKDGSHIKDLSKLNRDLSKVIYIDWDTKAFQLNPENALRIPQWSGDDDDTGLIDLANLIRTIVDSDVDDVRPILQYYSSCNDPLTEFRENQRKLMQIEESKMKAMHQRDESFTKNWGGKLFGYKRHS